MKIFLQIVLILVFVSCGSETDSKLRKHSYSLNIETSMISHDSFVAMVKFEPILNPCSIKWLEFAKGYDTSLLVHFLKLKNIGSHDIYILAQKGGSPSLGWWGIRKEDNGIIGVDESGSIKPPYYTPCIVKLIPNDEYYLYDFGEEQLDSIMFHSINKYVYFDTKDSSMVSIWVNHSDLKYYSNDMDYFMEYRHLLDSVKYDELKMWREAQKHNKKIIQIDSFAESQILKMIRNSKYE
ncbi:MAG: hypothetical protein WAT79_11055 [Saprospiraceae bacterium]